MTSQIEMLDKNRQLILNQMTHSELLNMTITWLHLHGFYVAGFRPGMNRRGKWETAVIADGKGWPDLFATRIETPTLIGVCRVGIEIKTEKDKLSFEQLQWRDWFSWAGLLYLVVRPRDFPDLLEKEITYKDTLRYL